MNKERTMTYRDFVENILYIESIVDELDIPRDYEMNRYREDYSQWTELSDTASGIADICDTLIGRIDKLLKMAEEIGIDDDDIDVVRLGEARNFLESSIEYVEEKSDEAYSNDDYDDIDDFYTSSEYESAYIDVMDKAVEVKDEIYDCSNSYDRLAEEILETID